jgi:periplasmic protein TonB
MISSSRGSSCPSRRRASRRSARLSRVVLATQDFPAAASTFGNTRAAVVQSLPMAANSSVEGSVLGGAPSAAPPPPQAPTRIRVGGDVQAAKLVKKVEPVYPEVRVHGTVRFTAIIGKDGHVQDLQLISGHPLLVPPAQEAVSQWVYRPTLLNCKPVEVITLVDVNFVLTERE